MLFSVAIAITIVTIGCPSSLCYGLGLESFFVAVGAVVVVPEPGLLDWLHSLLVALAVTGGVCVSYSPAVVVPTIVA